VIDAKHLCVNSRGISDIESSTVTRTWRKIKDAVTRRVLDYIKLETKLTVLTYSRINIKKVQERNK
jgi:GTP cyclohydrolase I